MKVVDKLNNKRILIWGYGREGKSTEDFLRRCCKVKSVSVYEGKREGIKEKDYDLIIKSPGIVMNDDNDKYTSQTELFLEEFRDNIIGITGTKGKSTTSTMLYSVLKQCSDKDVLLLGNIGQPCLDCYEKIKEDTVIIFEMSCHQLAHAKLSPHIAIFLNFFEEHLDYYGNLKNYFNAKSNISKNQTKDDYLIIGNSVPLINTKAKIVKILDNNVHSFELKIKGKHNQYNAEFVYYVAVNLMECNQKNVIKSIETFEGLAHRLEYVSTINDIDYYDDSISTIPEATIQAIQSIENIQTILIGGMDRKICYDKMVDFIYHNKQLNFICMYESGKRIYESSKECKNCYYVEDLKHAVRLAKEITKRRKACVLSPAAASYGYFKNFEERGDTFKKYIMCKDTKDN